MSLASIAIVEDQALVAEALKVTLERWGYEVVGIALSGTEAIQLIESSRPDLVLMYIMLQDDMDGIEAASIIGERFGVPAVYLTANSDPSTVERIRSTHSYGYLLKPYKDRELQVAVETAVYRHRSEMRRHVLYTLRDIVWQMQGVEDMEKLLRAIGQSMVKLGIPFQASSLNLLSPIPNPDRIRFYHIHPDNQYEEHGSRDLSELMKQIWSRGDISYRRDLEKEDLYGEREQLPRGHQVRCVLDVPFSHGTLAVNSDKANAFVDDHIDVLSEMADVLSEAFARLDYIRVLEERTRALERESRERREAESAVRINLGLQRVRNEMLRMRGEEDWQRVAAAFYAELRQLVDFDGCGFNIIDLTAGTYKGYDVTVAGLENEAQYEGLDPPLRRAMESGQPTYRANRSEIDKEHLRPMSVGVQSVLDVPFSRGTVAVNSLRQDAFNARAVSILEQFALVFNEAYLRLEDLQALKVTEEQLYQAKKMESIGELSAGLAHNFNNMLAANMGNIELAMMNAPHQVVTYLQVALEASREAADLVRELMLFSRSQSVQKKPVDLGAISRETVEFCRATFDRKIELNVHVQPSLPKVQGHNGQLKQLVLNLCINARDAVATTTERTPQVKVAIEAIEYAKMNPSREDHPPGPYVRLAVSDNGIGMDEATQQRIFDPFFTTKEVGKGTGLGLASVYGIARQHGGWVEVQSKPNIGTLFQVYLPVAQDKTEIQQREEVESIPRGHEVILVVDDDERVRSFLRLGLAKFGYTALLAADGAEGMEIYESQRETIDLVLLDLSMPRLSGQEVMQRMLAIDPQVRIVLFSGYAAEQTDSSGARAFIQKPLRLGPMLRLLRDVLDD